MVPDFKLYYKAVKIKEYSTSTKTGTQISGTELRAWKQIHTGVDNLQQRNKEHEKEKGRSSISGVRKAGQPHEKE